VRSVLAAQIFKTECRRGNRALEATAAIGKIPPFSEHSHVCYSIIRSSIGVSNWYASKIRQGYRLHPRHWLCAFGRADGTARANEFHQTSFDSDHIKGLPAHHPMTALLSFSMSTFCEL